MNKVKVDTRLFITCRLCLEDLGLYQIVPAVKEQILYCFGIQVEPFDGLPQLICKKCEATLSDYSAIKKKFIEKQEDLKTKIQESHNGQQSQAELKTSDSSENLANNNICKPRKRKPCISSSSSDLECNKTSKENSNEKDTRGNDEISASWPAGYTRHYVCRICSLRWVHFQLLKNHIKSRHSDLKRKYKHVFKRHCNVKLHKVDEKFNITGSKSKVVHSREKIIKSVDPNFYIIYAIKDKNDDGNVDDSHDVEEQNMNNKYYESTDSSEYGFLVKRKRKRLYSRSSNETVVLDTDWKLSKNDKVSQNCKKVQPTLQVSDCINIEDSSDNESENGKESLKHKTENEITTISSDNLKVDTATINDIINSSSSKYRKKYVNDSFLMKFNKNPNDIATQLKRKILSIGRKMISKNKHFSCTPIIRFMEYKNLDIDWLPRPVVFVNQESNCVRIMARLKNVGENVDYETGWISVVKAACGLDVSDSSKNANSVEVSLRELNATDVPEVLYTNIPETLPENAVLFADATTNVTDTKKLLNSNPVANPKQLPKKSSTTEMKLVKVTAGNLSNIEMTSSENNDFRLPIITSTTSLAVPFSIQENNNASSNDPEITNTKNEDQKSEGPRIKVKHVSELMSKETLNRMKEPNKVPAVAGTKIHLQNENNLINIYIPPITTVSQFHNALQPNNSTASLDTPEPAWKNEYMILDTSEMPNTKTNSPFEYFRRLLQLHNIILLDADNELSIDFHCLIKFKVLYKQETNNQPVILCLALLCSNNVFCLKVKDRNQDNINLTKISPNWQWEVLKIYKGEVVSKLLNNAQKVSNGTYEYTNIFLSLLKSIKLVKM